MSEQTGQNDLLKLAVREGDYKRVSQLIEGGVDASCITAAVIPPMVETSEHGAIMRYLFLNGTDVNHNTFDEGTLLMFSAGRGQLEYLQLYLDSGADINLPSAVNGLTGLHIGAKLNKPEVVEFFIEAGADVNRSHDDAPTSSDDPPRTYGEAPLHLAAAFADKEVIELLLAAGADKELVSSKGETPFDYAEKRQRPEQILEVLR